MIKNKYVLYLDLNLILYEQKCFISSIAGTIVYCLLGWFVYDILFPQMSTGDESIIGIFLGCLCYMLIYALIFVRWAHITTFKTRVTSGFTRLFTP